tara:strand:- start:378 stop:956 length:579 start_codon:yes stop_codon:yes gene_type:complete
MSKSKRIEKRINRIEDRFKKKVAKGKKGTDTDIELHERRIKDLKDKSPLNFGMFGAATIASGMTGAGGGTASALRGKRPKTLKEMMRGEPTMQDLSNKLDEISSNIGSGNSSPTAPSSGPAAGDYSSTPIGPGTNTPGTSGQGQVDTLPGQNTTGVIGGGFSPRTAAVGAQMFGSPVSGSFDRQLEAQQQIL